MGENTKSESESSPTWFWAMRSQDALELLGANPNAFILLYQIAYRAQRTAGWNKHHLKPGEAFIGDHDEIGLTRQKYRTAKKILADGHFATFKATNRGTIATLIDSRVFHINAAPGNHQSNQRLTISQPSANQQATTTNNENKEKNANKGTRFAPPTLEEVKKSAGEIGLPESEAERFFNYYSANGWKIGRTTMKSYPHALANWKSRCQQHAHENKRNAGIGTDANEQGYKIAQRLQQRRRGPNI